LAHKKQKTAPFINREISWLSFNERVLQEAEDERNPLIERFRFLGIFSNNLDEFYRVRVASVRRLKMLSKKVIGGLNLNPAELLEQIHEKVEGQQERFEAIFNKLKKESKKEEIYFVDETQLSDIQRAEIFNYFTDKVRPVLVPLMLSKKRELPVLKDKAIYLGIKLSDDEGLNVAYSMLKVPSDTVDRFYVFKPNEDGKHYIIMLDDIIRANLKEIYSIFSYSKMNAYTIKFTRDAELDIDDDIGVSLMDQVSKSIENRKTGEPVRFIYDKEMPDDLLYFLTKKIGIGKEDNIIPGGRYHNFKDFMAFPKVGKRKLTFTKLPPLPHPFLKHGKSVMDQVDKRDIMLNYPYQSFGHIIDLLREAAIDPKVKSIKINLYRVASNSKIINALINAVRNGKKVQVIVELRARFDEENNIYWSNVLQDAGAEIIFGVKGLKVHSKLILIEKSIGGGESTYYAHVGTGNFHEGTAKIYGDTALITSDKRISLEVKKVFEFFESNYKVKRYSHLILSPNGSRRKFIQLINAEIKNAKQGNKAEIVLKLNNLVDEEVIRKLYEASQAGVKIFLIIRGICSLVPGVPGWSDNIEAISIVDRFLEHSRILYFYAGGEEKIYISSADWMVRNLDMRVEVTAPIYDEQLKKQLKKMLQLQMNANTKARKLNAKLNNKYRVTEGEPVHSQLETYAYFKGKLAKHSKK